MHHALDVQEYKLHHTPNMIVLIHTRQEYKLHHTPNMIVLIHTRQEYKLHHTPNMIVLIHTRQEYKLHHTPNMSVLTHKRLLLYTALLIPLIGAVLWYSSIVSPRAIQIQSRLIRFHIIMCVGIHNNLQSLS